MSFYKYSGQSQKQVKVTKIILIVHYYMDLLESTYLLLKTALSKAESKSPNYIKGTFSCFDMNFSSLLVAKWVSWKMDQTFELLDSVKKSNRPAVFGSSLSRSVSSTSIGTEEEVDEISIRIEDVLYDFTCLLAKDAGIQELLENYDEAAALFSIANYLADCLKNPSEMAPISSLISNIPPLDYDYKQSLINLSDRIRDRITSMQNKIY